MMMGRLYLAFACALSCAIASVTLAVPAQAGGGQPMKWSKHQWRSDLFDTYPLRPKYYRTRIVRHVVHFRVHQAPSSPAVTAKPRARPLFIRGGQPVNASPSRQALAVTCHGPLVLTWDGRSARRTCH
jgi:hypothetical protein